MGDVTLPAVTAPARDESLDELVPDSEDERSRERSRSPTSSPTAEKKQVGQKRKFGTERRTMARLAQLNDSTDRSDSEPPVARILRRPNKRNRVLDTPVDSEEEVSNAGRPANQRSISPARDQTPLFLPASPSAASLSPQPRQRSDDDAEHSRSPTPPAKRPRRRRLVRRRPTPEPESGSESEADLQTPSPPRQALKTCRRHDPDDSSDPESSDVESEASESSDESSSNSDITEMDDEDRDDLSSTVDSEAEREVDDGDEVLEVGSGEDERLIIKRAPPQPPLRKRADGHMLGAIHGEQDLIFTRLRLDPLPEHWQEYAEEDDSDLDFGKPPVSDTDGEQSDDDAAYSQDEDAADADLEEDDDDDEEDGEYREADEEEEVVSEQEEQKRDKDKKRDPSPVPSDMRSAGGPLSQDEITRALCKRRRQMDDINFQRLCITLAVRYRNGASHSNKALEFLDQRYFVAPWQWLQGKMRYAARCLERSSWTNVKHDYKDYSECTQSPISFSEHCEGCHKDHQERCNSYTDVRMTGGYEELTLTPLDRPPFIIALGPDCRTSFVESFEVYRQVCQTAMEFERDVFDRKHMFVAVKDILHKDVIDIDRLVAFLRGRGTDRRVMKSIHRTYDKIKKRRIDWFTEREAFSAFQRDEGVYWRIQARRQMGMSVPPRRVRKHLVGPTRYDDY